jgi:hypothetical protein
MPEMRVKRIVSLLPLGEGPGKRGVAVVVVTQALSPTLSQRERQFEYSAAKAIEAYRTIGVRKS